MLDVPVANFGSNPGLKQILFNFVLSLDIDYKLYRWTVDIHVFSVPGQIRMVSGSHTAACFSFHILIYTLPAVTLLIDMHHSHVLALKKKVLDCLSEPIAEARSYHATGSCPARAIFSFVSEVG